MLGLLVLVIFLSDACVSETKMMGICNFGMADGGGTVELHLRVVAGLVLGSGRQRGAVERHYFFVIKELYVGASVFNRITFHKRRLCEGDRGDYGEKLKWWPNFNEEETDISDSDDIIGCTFAVGNHAAGVFSCVSPPFCIIHYRCRYDTYREEGDKSAFLCPYLLCEKFECPPVDCLKEELVSARSETTRYRQIMDENVARYEKEAGDLRSKYAEDIGDLQKEIEDLKEKHQRELDELRKELMRGAFSARAGYGKAWE